MRKQAPQQRTINFFAVKTTILFFFASLLGCLMSWGQSPAENRLQSLLDSAQTLLSTRPERAGPVAESGFDLASQQKDTASMALACKLKGNGHLFQGQYPEAIGDYQEAFRLYHAIRDTEGLWAVNNNIGVAHHETGNLNNALDHHWKALEIARGADLTAKIATSLINLGNVRTDLRDYNGALESYREALNINEQEKNSAGMADCFSGMAGVFTELAQYDSSLHYQQKAIPLVRESGNVRKLIPILINMASQMGEKGQFDSAGIYLREAGSYESFMEPRIRVHYLNIKGLNLQRQHRYSEAKGLYLAALDTAKSYQLDNQTNWLRLYLARTLQKMNQHSAAFDTLYFYATEQYRMTQLNSANYVKNLEEKYQAKLERDSLAFLQSRTRLEADARAAELKASRFRLGLFIATGGIVVLALSGGLVYSRNRNKQVQTEAERQRVELENRLLRSQMTPHFLYNSMNAIQQFIGENDTLQAEIYLSKFANLMRAILKHSRQERVSLEDELHALEDYIQLEKLRFQEKFSYQINYDREMDLEMIFVPPMLIQPHVENAILHGLSLKPMGGNLEIDIIEKQNELTITISDNGIGRDASKSIREFNRQHPSLAIEITEERMVQLNQAVGKKGFSQVIKDLYYDNGQPAGTQVVLQYLI